MSKDEKPFSIRVSEARTRIKNAYDAACGPDSQMMELVRAASAALNLAEDILSALPEISDSLNIEVAHRLVNATGGGRMTVERARETSREIVILIADQFSKAMLSERAFRAFSDAVGPMEELSLLETHDRRMRSALRAAFLEVAERSPPSVLIDKLTGKPVEEVQAKRPMPKNAKPPFSHDEVAALLRLAETYNDDDSGAGTIIRNLAAALGSSEAQLHAAHTALDGAAVPNDLDLPKRIAALKDMVLLGLAGLLDSANVQLRVAKLGKKE